MRRRWIVATVLAVLLLGSSGTSADPTNWGQLAQIILWLQQIDQTLKDLNVAVDDIRGNLAQVYPEAGLRQIETLFEPVDSIKEEVEKLACNWRFTPRVEKLRLALFGGGSFCRSDWISCSARPRRPSTGISRATTSAGRFDTVNVVAAFWKARTP